MQQFSPDIIELAAHLRTLQTRESSYQVLSEESQFVLITLGGIGPMITAM